MIPKLVGVDVMFTRARIVNNDYCRAVVRHNVACTTIEISIEKQTRAKPPFIGQAFRAQPVERRPHQMSGTEHPYTGYRIPCRPETTLISTNPKESPDTA